MRNQRRNQSQGLNSREEQEQIELESFFLKKFSYLKQQSIEYLKNYVDLPFRPEDKYNCLADSFGINSINFQKKMLMTKPQENVASATWDFSSITSKEQYYRIQDAICSYLPQNDYIHEISIHLSGKSQLYGILLALESIPFIKRFEQAKLYFGVDVLLNQRLKQNQNLLSAVGESIELITQMIFIRKSTTTIGIYYAIREIAESVSIGIRKSKISSSHKLTRFLASNLFSEVSSQSVQLALDNLSNFRALNDIELETVNLNEDESVLSLNKILSKGNTLSIQFRDQDLSINRNIPLLFGENYNTLTITYSIDELGNPKKLDQFLEKLSTIKNAHNLKLNNIFSLNQLPHAKASTVISKTSELRKILPGSLILEKLEKEEQALKTEGGQENQHQSISEFPFFERFINNNLYQLTYSGQLSNRLSDTLLNLCRAGKINNLVVNQQSLSLNNIIHVPFQVKKIYDEELNIDLRDIYSIAQKQKSFQFQINIKQGSINLQGNHLSITINSFIKNQIFNPFEFEIERLEKLNLTAFNLEDLFQYEEIFLVASKNPKLTFINLTLTLCEALRKKITKNTLHKQSNLNGVSYESLQYLRHLTHLAHLKNLVLVLDFNQTIIDSLEYLLSNSKSIKTLILRRTHIQQYVFNLSKVINALAISQTVTHAQLDLKYENISIIHPPHKDILENEKLNNLYLPVASLLENPQCKLLTLEILENDSLSNGRNCMITSKLKKLNETVLGLDSHYRHYGHSSDSLYNQAQSQNLVKQVYGYNDNQKFITEF